MRLFVVGASCHEVVCVRQANVVGSGDVEMVGHVVVVVYPGRWDSRYGVVLFFFAGVSRSERGESVSVYQDLFVMLGVHGWLSG